MTPENAAVAEGGLIGRCIDERYRLEAVIGVGGLGSVYRATHTKLQRPVAVKLLHESFGESQIQRGRFAREAKALAALQHPNIVAVLDYGVSEAQPYLVMELLEGETLSQRLHEGPLPIESALQIAQQLLEALSFMHRARLVHRDVKPSNVFLLRDSEGHDHVKVLDFGLAKFTAAPMVTSDPTLTRDGAILGTPAYMSPEQATGENVDARSDVYAVGVILFRMLSGRLPFEGDAIEQVRSHLIAPVPPLHRPQPDPDVDRALEALIRRAMEKRREDRYADAGQMLRALVESFPQYVHEALPEHEPVLPDPFAVDALNADWLLSMTDASSETPTLPRDPRGSAEITRTRESVQRVGRAMRSLVITSVRLFAGISVLLVVGAGAIYVLLLRSEADRVELTALQRRVQDRLLERSSSRGAGEPSGAEHGDPRASNAASSGAAPAEDALASAEAKPEAEPSEEKLEGAQPAGERTVEAPPSSESAADQGSAVPAPALGPPASAPAPAANALAAQAPTSAPGAPSPSAEVPGVQSATAPSPDAQSATANALAAPSPGAQSPAASAPGAQSSEHASAGPATIGAASAAQPPVGQWPSTEWASAQWPRVQAPVVPPSEATASAAQTPVGQWFSAEWPRAQTPVAPPSAAAASATPAAHASAGPPTSGATTAADSPAPTTASPRDLETSVSAIERSGTDKVPLPPMSNRLAAALEKAGNEGATVLALEPPLPAPEPPRAAARSETAQSSSKVPATDPWKEPIPPKLRSARRAALARGPGSEPMILALREYNKAQRNDPRGHLLLGQLYLNRFWRADALSQFSIALTLDPSVRGAPEVLPGLLSLVIHGDLAAQANRLIIAQYGTEAIPAVDAAIARQKESKPIARLRWLRSRLTRE